MKEFALSKVFQLLEPGPVLLVTTAAKDRPNIMTMTWQMPLEFEPPLLACVIGPWDHTFTALRSTKECVLAIPAFDLIEKAVDIGNCSGRDIDKFHKFRLTPLPAEKVSAPLIAQCLYNLECKLIDRVARYDINILEVVKAWTNPDRKQRRIFHANGDGTFAPQGKNRDLKDRMVKWQSIL